MGRINWPAVILVILLLGGLMIVFNSESTTVENPSFGSSTGNSTIPITLPSDDSQQQDAYTAQNGSTTTSANTPYMDSLQQSSQQGGASSGQ